jgi:hypothetical protein
MSVDTSNNPKRAIKAAASNPASDKLLKGSRTPNEIVCATFSAYHRYDIATIIKGDKGLEDRAQTGSLFFAGCTLTNYSNVPSRLVHQAIRHCTDLGELPAFDCVVTSSRRGYSGRCISYSDSPLKFKPLVKVAEYSDERQYPLSVESLKKGSRRVARLDKTGDKITFQGMQSQNGYLDFFVLDRTELLIHVVAHELCHLWQRYCAVKQFHGAPKKLRERDSDEYAIAKVREWRRKKLAREVERAYGTASLLFSGFLRRLAGMLAWLLRRAEAKK